MADPEVWVGCDLHDAEGLGLRDGELAPMKRLEGVKSVQVEVDDEACRHEPCRCSKVPVQGLGDVSFSGELRLTQAGREFFADEFGWFPNG